MKLFQVVEIFPALQALGATKLSAKAGYRIAKAINLVRPEIQAYEEQRIKLAQELGTKSEDGLHFRFEDTAAKTFMEQLNALLDENCTIALPTIAPDELGEIAIEPQHLAVLDGIVIKE